MMTLNSEEELALLRERCAELLAENRCLQRAKRHLEEKMQALLRRLHGPRADRVDPAQLMLDFGDESEEAAPPPDLDGTPDDEEPIAGKKRKRGHKGRQPLPKNLPVEEVIHDVPEDIRMCPCCETPLAHIGSEVTEELDFRPAAYFVRKHIRPKYACKKCQEAPMIAELHSQPIHKGRPGPGLLAQIVTAKYADHCPLHRQRGIMKRHGIDIPVSTLCDWVAQAARILQPVVDFLHDRILSSEIVQSDDTRIQVQRNSKKGPTQRSFLWAYLAQGGETVFDFTTGRGKAGPQAFLKGYQGRYLQTDAYAGYREICETGKVRAVGCWAHARRRYVDAMANNPEEASVALASIRRIYKIDREARNRGVSPSELAEIRQKKSRPILEALWGYLKALKPQLLERSKLADAVGYTLNQWKPLIRFLDDGRLELDNNRAERTMRHVAVGRRNWVFCGSEEGGRRAAGLYSVVVTCKRADIDIYSYLQDYFARFRTHPPDEFEALTPLQWAAARASPKAAGT